MMGAVAETVQIHVTDVSGQHTVRVPAVPKHLTVGEMVRGLLAKMGLSRQGVNGEPIDFQVRLEREGRHLNGSETVGEALRDEDSVVLTPSIDAG